MNEQALNIGLRGRLKHGDFLKVMDERGWNLRQLGEALHLNLTSVCAMVNLKWVPRRISPEFEARLVAVTGKLPEDLWPDWSKSKDFLQADKRVSIYKPLTRAQLAGAMLKQLPPTPEQVFTTEERDETIRAVLETLTPREAEIVEAIEMDGRTLRDIGHDFDIGPERVRQIHAKALRKLRHPSRSGKLRPFLNDALDVKDSEPGRILTGKE